MAERTVIKDECVLQMEYEPTLMYGSYSQQRLETQAKHIRSQTRQDPLRRQWIDSTVLCRIFTSIKKKTLAKIGVEWLILAMLGVIMSFISFAIDYVADACNSARLWIYAEVAVGQHPVVRYLAWIFLPVCLLQFASGFVYLVAPQAAGSGIPEMKTVMRGVVLKGYLSFRTLIAKIVGLSAALGSGMPLSKEGPLVHIGSIVGTLLTGENRGNGTANNDMLAAACAVGISCSLGAPISGGLFSFEVTSGFITIRNYFRGFFSAVVSFVTFRFLEYLVYSEDILTAFYQTYFHVGFICDPCELFVFAFIGIAGGLSGALFVLLIRKYVMFIREYKQIKSFLSYNRFILPSLVALFIGSMSFPLGLGRYLAPTLSSFKQIDALFGNFTWMSDQLTVQQADLLSHWNYKDTNLFASLSIYSISTYFFSILTSALAVPTGSIVPMFKVGAAFGRILGEALSIWLPKSVANGTVMSSLAPGCCAIVGAAAFSAGVTQSFFIGVVVLEITGQMHHVLPILVAVFLSIGISSLLQPSIYDSMMMMKNLPFLPNISSYRDAVHSVTAKDIMSRDVKYICNGITYRELKEILAENRDIPTYPFLDNPRDMVLRGSVQRVELVRLFKDRWKISANQQETDNISMPNRSKKTRFQVSHTTNDNDVVDSDSESDKRKPADHQHQLPVKSILKKSSSFQHFFRIRNHQQEDWREDEPMMNVAVNFEERSIDPALFQLDENVSLLKIHSIFSLHSVQHVYVTRLGQLMGVVSLTELRQAIEDVNAGKPIGINNETTITNDSETVQESQTEDSKLINTKDVEKSDRSIDTEVNPNANER